MFNLPFFSKKEFKIKPQVLVVLDGFGLAPPSEGNAISLAKTPNYDKYLKTYPSGELIASGESVGLPANEVGNTEVGHLTLGAGRVVLQALKRIDLAIENGSFFDNKVLLETVSHVKENSSSLHVLGLLSTGNVHSSLSHLYALLQLCKKEQVGKVYLHLFTDGRDSPPKQGLEMIERLERHLDMIKVGKIASISGRYYAMDRDLRWERTEKAYRAICLGHAIQTFSALDAIKSAYARGQSDEFVEPTVIADKDGPVGVVGDSDAVIFFNYRIDRPRQLTMAFILPHFENLNSFDFGYDPETGREKGQVKMAATFNREKVLRNLFFLTMTEYHKNLPVSGVAFPPEVIENPMAKVLSDAGLQQLHMAESEKQRFVTYYFNGLNEKRFPGEEVDIVPSPKVATYDKKPEMALPQLVSEFKKQLSRDVYSFVVINFANPDMVGHSGNLSATVKAIEIVDKYLGQLTEAVVSQDGTAIITADHGNAEQMLTFPSTTYFYTSEKGIVNTEHSNNPVPIIILDKKLSGQKLNINNAGLADVAPTILKIMGVSIPPQMTGRNLLENVKS